MSTAPLSLAEQREILLSVQKTVAEVLKTLSEIKDIGSKRFAKSSSNSIKVDTPLEVVDVHRQMNDSSVEEQISIDLQTPDTSLIVNDSKELAKCAIPKLKEIEHAKLVDKSFEFPDLYFLPAFELDEKGTSHTHQVFDEMPQRSISKYYKMFGSDFNFAMRGFDPGIQLCSLTGRFPYNVYHSHRVFVEMPKRKRKLFTTQNGFNMATAQRPPEAVQLAVKFGSVVNLNGWPPPVKIFCSKLELSLQVMFSVLSHFSTPVSVMGDDWIIVLCELDRPGFSSWDLLGNNIEIHFLGSKVDWGLITDFVHVVVKWCIFTFVVDFLENNTSPRYTATVHIYLHNSSVVSINKDTTVSSVPPVYMGSYNIDQVNQWTSALVVESMAAEYFLSQVEDSIIWDFYVLNKYTEVWIQKYLVGSNSHNSYAISESNDRSRGSVMGNQSLDVKWSWTGNEAVEKGLEIDSVVLQMVSHIRVQQKGIHSWDDMIDQSSLDGFSMDYMSKSSTFLEHIVGGTSGRSLVQITGMGKCKFKGLSAVGLGGQVNLGKVLTQKHVLANTAASAPMIYKFDQAKNMSPVWNVDDKCPSYRGSDSLMFHVYITLYYLTYERAEIRIHRSRLLWYEVSSSTSTVMTFPFWVTLQGWTPTGERQPFGIIPLLSSVSLGIKMRYAYVDELHSQCFASKRFCSYSWSVLRSLPCVGVYGMCSSVAFSGTSAISDGGNLCTHTPNLLSGQTVYVNDPGGLSVHLYKQLSLYTQNGYMKATIVGEMMVYVSEDKGGSTTDYFFWNQAVHLRNSKECTKQGYNGNGIDVQMFVLAIFLPQWRDVPYLVSIMASLPATRTHHPIAASTIQVSVVVSLTHLWLCSCINLASLSANLAKFGLYATLQKFFQGVDTIFLLVMVISILVAVIGTWIFDPGVGCPMFYTKIQTIHLFLDIFRIGNLTAVVFYSSKHNVQNTRDSLRHALCYMGKLKIVFVICSWDCRVYWLCIARIDFWILSVVTPVTINNCVNEECHAKLCGIVLSVSFLPSHPRGCLMYSFCTTDACEAWLLIVELHAIYPSVDLSTMQRRAHFHALPTCGQVSLGCFASLRDFGACYSYLTDLRAHQFIRIMFNGNSDLLPAIFLDYSVVATCTMVGYFAASSSDHHFNTPAALVVFPVGKLVKILFNSASLMFHVGNYSNDGIESCKGPYTFHTNVCQVKQ